MFLFSFCSVRAMEDDEVKYEFIFGEKVLIGEKGIGAFKKIRVSREELDNPSEDGAVEVIFGVPVYAKNDTTESTKGVVTTTRLAGKKRLARSEGYSDPSEPSSLRSSSSPIAISRSQYNSKWKNNNEGEPNLKAQSIVINKKSKEGKKDPSEGAELSNTFCSGVGVFLLDQDWQQFGTRKRTNA